jgi:hypothetical protein
MASLADQIVVEAKTGSVTSAPVRSEVKAMLATVGRHPHAVSVASPYGSYGASQVGRDGRIAFATVNFDAQAQGKAPVVPERPPISAVSGESLCSI